MTDRPLTTGTLSTHVLDSTHGRPAAGLAVTLTTPDGAEVDVVTDADGRAGFPDPVPAGEGRLSFASGAWFDAQGVDHFHPSIEVRFRITAGEHHHVALLLSPFAYTTYRGS